MISRNNVGDRDGTLLAGFGYTRMSLLLQPEGGGEVRMDAGERMS